MVRNKKTKPQAVKAAQVEVAAAIENIQRADSIVEVGSNENVSEDSVTFQSRITRRSTQIKKKPIPMTQRCNIVFPPSRFRRFLKKGRFADRIGVGAGIYGTAVVEYLIAEILELSGDAAKDNKKKRITPRHIMLAVRTDDEINKLFANATFACGGVLPSINPVLLQKHTPLRFSKKRFDDVMNADPKKKSAKEENSSKKAPKPKAQGGKSMPKKPEPVSQDNVDEDVGEQNDNSLANETVFEIENDGDSA